MYIPKPFNVDDQKQITTFLTENGFGQLVSTVEGRLFATPLPFLYLAESNTLLFHLAKQNPQWQAVEQQELLVTVQGPHEYISPTWYNTPGVPTWNYQIAHIYGTGKLITEAEKLARIVDELSHKYEDKRPAPWSFEYNPAMLKAIVGIEMTIKEIQCKFKLSQNKSGQDRNNIITNLEAEGFNPTAEAMKNNAN